jgi:hypothetical protein
MRWDFSLEPGPIASGSNSPVEIGGLRIYKTLYDDNNVELAKVQTTAEDARENAEPGFIEEYLTSALSIFSIKLEEIFQIRETYPASLPSLGILLGNNLRDSLRDIVIIANGDDA